MPLLLMRDPHCKFESVELTPKLSQLLQETFKIIVRIDEVLTHREVSQMGHSWVLVRAQRPHAWQVSPG
jgi:hypothetical protein